MENSEKNLNIEIYRLKVVFLKQWIEVCKGSSYWVEREGIKGFGRGGHYRRHPKVAIIRRGSWKKKTYRN